MNAKALYKTVDQINIPEIEGAGFVHIDKWFCSQCSIIYLSKSDAEKCCSPNTCSCGQKITEKYYKSCGWCRNKEKYKREEDRFNKSEKLKESDWTGPVWYDCSGGADGYFRDLGEFHDWLSDEIEDWDGDEPYDTPKYVWSCTSTPVIFLDADQIVNNGMEEAYEGFDISDLNGMEELRASMEVFNKKNEKCMNWDIDYSKSIVLDRK